MHFAGACGQRGSTHLVEVRAQQQRETTETTKSRKINYEYNDKKIGEHMHAQTRLNIQVNTMAKRKPCNVLLISFPTSVIFAQNGPRASCKDFTLDGSAKCWLFLAASHKNNFLAAVSAGVLGLPCGVNEAPCGVCGVALWTLGVTGVRVWGPVPKPARKVAAMSGAGRFLFLGSCDNT